MTRKQPEPPALTVLRISAEEAGAKLDALSKSLELLQAAEIRQPAALTAAEDEGKVWFARAKAILERMFSDTSEADALTDAMSGGTAFMLGGYETDWRDDVVAFQSKLARVATALTALRNKIDVFDAPGTASPKGLGSVGQWHGTFQSTQPAEIALPVGDPREAWVVKWERRGVTYVQAVVHALGAGGEPELVSIGPFVVGRLPGNIDEQVSTRLGIDGDPLRRVVAALRAQN